VTVALKEIVLTAHVTRVLAITATVKHDLKTGLITLVLVTLY
jgi:hypothetical protein